MKVSRIDLLKKDSDNVADLLISTLENGSYIARIQKLENISRKILKHINPKSKTNYVFVPDCLIVDEIREDSLMELITELIDDGDFHNVFRKI